MQLKRIINYIFVIALLARVIMWPFDSLLFPAPVSAAEILVHGSLRDATAEFGASPAVVFTTDQIGYSFFITATTVDLAYKKTTDGGTTWSAVVVIDTAVTGWTNVAVWYDQWTPGDTTGTKIHIAASDTTTDDIYYTFLDTNGDTLKGSVVAAVSGTTTLNALADGPPTITKGASGNYFIAANFASTAGGKVSKATDGTGDTWTDATPASWSSVAIDQIQLLPLSTDNDVIAIRADTANNDIDSRVYDEVGDAWDTSWTSIGSLTENTTYDQWFSASIKKSTGNVSLAVANQTNNAANDINFYSFTDSGRTWTQGGNLITNDATVMMPATLIDENNADIYVAYLRGTVEATMGIYFRKSTDGGATWSDESVKLHGLSDDVKGLRGNLLSTTRLGVVWYNDDLNDIFFSTVSDTIATTIDDTIRDGTSEFGPSPAVVFTTDQIGYVFYIDATSADLAYKKTSDGGKNWSETGVVIDTTLAWVYVSVWYDQWTPGDTTGTKIHIAGADTTNDDIYYTFLDTNGDSLKGSVVSAVSGTTTLTALADGPPTITKGASGFYFIAGNFASTAGGKVSKATDGTGDTWTNITPASWSTVAIDQIQLLPLTTDDDVIAIKAQTADNTIRSRVYDEVGDVWDGAWSASIGSLTENTTYDQWYSATVKKSTGDIYLAVANQTNNAANDINFYSYTDSGRTWSTQGDLFTNDATVMMPSVLMDENSGTLYVTYLRGTLGTSVRAYYKTSTDGGANWSAESDRLSTGIFDDQRGLRGNLQSTERLYAVWYSDDLNDIMGTTVADLYTAEQSAYGFLENQDATTVGIAYGSQDVPYLLNTAGKAFRLRMLSHFNQRLNRSGDTFKLQFAERSGTCDIGFSGETYADVTGATAIAFYDNATPTDGSILSSNAHDPTHSTDTINNQTYEEANNFSNSVSSIPVGEDGKWDFSLYDNGAPVDTTYCFRMVTSAGSELSAYDVIPQITTDDGVEPSLIFSISDHSLGFGTLSPSSARYATGTVGSATDTVDAHVLEASSTGVGYTISIQGNTLSCTDSPCDPNTITAIGDTAVASIPGTEQFGMRVTVNSGTGTATAPYDGADWAFDTAAFPDEIASGAGDDTTTQFGVRFIGNISDDTEAGVYTTELLYTAVATF